MPISRPLAGMLLVAFGSIGFGVMPLFARTAYAEGLTPLSLMVWRFGIAVLCCLPLLPHLLRRDGNQRRDLRFAVIAGACYIGSMVFYFVALQYLSVALTVLILFTYPLFTILVGWLGFREKLTLRNAVAALLVLLAATLILWPSLSAEAGLNDQQKLAVLLAFIPPFAYAVFVHVAARRMGGMTIRTRLGGVFFGGLLTMVAMTLVVEGSIILPASPLAWAACAALAIFSTFGSLGLMMVGAPMAGAERSSIAGAGELVTALLVGLLAYNEAVTMNTLMGAALILLAIAVAAQGSDQKQEKSP
ncbi:DMT family transporter [Ferrovibrio sp.]|uniref:DMT family transporter n=1 Tax=Ferrovibrio sp. TaxID=1917215 RepID=UPI0035AECD1B